ncbi:Putative methylase yubD [Agrobacterium tumefaciens]|uniref:DNA methyltransferase n=1 Tax=Agrobacterium tumefaciens TaxID=358 RepID=UPI001BB7CFA9|nr:DNA methyltransferase [Agrobacterium tumefaciens]QTK80989.1 Putative methylase yubD [Agrobacterium tumefaciens]
MALIPSGKPTPADAQNSSKVSQSQYSMPIDRHIVFCKDYPSRKGLFEARYECAYALAKGRPQLPNAPLSDLSGWVYTGNILHPTQKPVEVLEPLIRTYCPEGGLVLDPFCGSGFFACRG